MCSGSEFYVIFIIQFASEQGSHVSNSCLQEVESNRNLRSSTSKVVAVVRCVLTAFGTVGKGFGGSSALLGLVFISL